MKRNTTQFRRLMELHEAIRSGKYPNCLSFAMDYEVAQKTIQRDIDFLRDSLNAPIEFDREKHGFYYKDVTWFLPSIILSEGELMALLIASRALEQYHGTPVAGEIKRVFEKISGILPEKISIPPEYLFSHFTFTNPPSKPVDEKVWIALIRGLLNQKAVQIKYKAFESPDAKEHLVDPYHVANLRGEWYVFGYSRRSEKLTPFSMARVKSAQVTKESFTIPAGFNPQRLFDATFGRFTLLPGDKAYKIRLRFSKEVAPWVLDREWHPQQKITRLTGGDIEVQFTAAGLMEVQHWVLAWGRNVKVLEPAELKKSVTDEIRAMAVQAGMMEK
jgi:predicted DNA-binding transcriptional regulator YafY